MKQTKLAAVGLTAVLLVQGCATPPPGPMVSAIRGQGKTPEQFEQDNAVCKQYASQTVAGQAEQANNQAVGAAVLGTVLGAGLGAAVGGGRGAGIGAASGAVVGSSIGANSSGWANMSIQQRYDATYSQCMYSRGNQIANYRPGMYPPPPGGYYVPAPGYYAAPPPPGYYPPPPPPY